MSDTTPETSAIDEHATDGAPSDVETGQSDTPAEDVATAVTTEPEAEERLGSEADAGGPEVGDAVGDDAVLDDVVGDDADAGVAAGSADGGRSSRLKQLEREGEVAADFLETLLDIADLDGDIDVDVDGDRAAVAIVDSDEGRVPRRLVGQDGQVLEALQELTRLAVQVETGERSRLMLDVAGFRAERRAALVSLAQVAIAEVQSSGTRKALEPMSAFERKVVHDVVAAAGLVSESEGVDPHRHVVILPA